MDISIPQDFPQDNQIQIVNQSDFTSEALRNEDNQFIEHDNNRPEKVKIFNLQVDRRISLDSDEIRDAIQAADELYIERPIPIIQSTSVRDLYNYPSISTIGII